MESMETKKLAFHPSTLLGNPFGITTFPRPRLLAYFKVQEHERPNPRPLDLKGVVMEVLGPKYKNVQVDSRRTSVLRHRGYAPHRRNRKNSTQDDPGWTSVETMPAKMENRETLRLVAELPASGRQIRTSRRELSRDASVRLVFDSAEAFMRWALLIESHRRSYEQISTRKSL
jgi:hypothetical protein